MYNLDNATVGRLELQFKIYASNEGNTKQVAVSDHELINLQHNNMQAHIYPEIVPRLLQLSDLQLCVCHQIGDTVKRDYSYDLIYMLEAMVRVGKEIRKN